jgi:hypothetical protein
MYGVDSETRIMKVWNSERLDLLSPWLAMGYRFNQQASLASFSLYFLLFGWDFKLPTSIWQDAMIVISLNDLVVWVHACE